jgi:anti-sigma B factor antagonist
MGEPLGCSTLMVHLTEASADFGLLRRMVSRTQVVVALTGELDIATRQVAYDACVTSESRDIVVDLGAVSFMDCSGYGALMAARAEFGRRGGSLTLRNARGEPARLLLLLGEGDVAC